MGRGEIDETLPMGESSKGLDCVEVSQGALLSLLRVEKVTERLRLNCAIAQHSLRIYKAPSLFVSALSSPSSTFLSSAPLHPHIRSLAHYGPPQCHSHSLALLMGAHGTHASQTSHIVYFHSWLWG